MKIVLIGAPGSGKTWLAKKLSEKLSLLHIEADTLYWEENSEVLPHEFKRRVSEQIKVSEHWVLEGHIGKIGEIVLPHAHKVIIINTPHIEGLIRTIKRDGAAILSGPMRTKHMKKMIFNILKHNEMFKRREELIAKVIQTQKSKVIFWNGSEDLFELEEKIC